MRRGYYSPFWLAGGHLTSNLWAERVEDDALEPQELAAWLIMSDAERTAVVEAYLRQRQRVAA